MSYYVKHIATTWSNYSIPRYLSKNKECDHTKSCMWKFITALLVIAENWKYPKSTSTIGEINKSQYIHTNDHYSVIKKTINYDTLKNTDESHNHYVDGKKPDPKDIIPFNSIYTKF